MRCGVKGTIHPIGPKRGLHRAAAQTFALTDALKALFSEPRLPDNPCFYLANVLSAYVDQSPLWKQSRETITAAIDDAAGVEVRGQREPPLMRAYGM